MSTGPPVDRIAVSPGDAAVMMGCSRATIYNLIADGKLRRFKVRGSARIPVADLEALVGGADDAA